MEELQLSLTTVRVEQKNFGIWLKSLQVGQMLQALVSDKLPSGQLLLKIAGHQIIATADPPLQKGTTLTLEVTGLNPLPILKIINTTGQNLAVSSSLPAQLQLLMPRQNAVIDPLLVMLGDKNNANFLSLAGPDVLKQLQKNLPRLTELSQPGILQKVLGQSGIFLETLLKRQVFGSGQLTSYDLKAELFRLLARVNEKILTLGDTVNGQQELAKNVKQQLEGALASISLKQLTASQIHNDEAMVWSFEIPFRCGDTVKNMLLLIERESSDDSRSSENDLWQVMLSVDIEPLGNIDTALTLRDGKICLVFTSEREDTARLVSGQSQQLIDGLARGGLEVSVLRSEVGAKRQWSHLSLSEAGVDEMI